jgi:hypothetical protein
VTISSIVSKNVYQADGSSVTYPYTFKIFQNSELLIQEKDNDTGAVTTISSGFSITGAGSNTGGNVVFDSPPLATKQIIFTRDIALLQSTDLNEYDPFPSQTIENNLDRLIMIAQQLKELQARCIQLDAASTLNAVLGDPADNAGLLIKVNSDGTGFEYGTVPGLSYTFPTSSTGYLVQTASGTATCRSIASTDLLVSNGDGVSGDTTINIPSTLNLTGKTITGGTFTGGTYGEGGGGSGPPFDNIDFSGNQILAVDSNGSIQISGDGTGKVILGQATSNGVQLIADQAILDSSGNKYLSFTKAASSLNWLTIGNAATGGVPFLRSNGQSNTGIRLKDSNDNTILLLSSTAAATKSLTITNGTSNVSISATTGADILFKNAGGSTVFSLTGLGNDNGLSLTPGSGANPTFTSLVTNMGINFTANGTGKFVFDAGASGGGIVLQQTQPILDFSNNELISFTKTASAVNQVNITNSATGNAPIISAAGQSNRGLQLADSNGAVSLDTQLGQIKLFVPSTSSVYAGFKVGASGATIWTLPVADGSSGQAMTTDGAGNLSFATISGGSGFTMGGRLSLTSNTPVTTADVTGATTLYYTPYKSDNVYVSTGMTTFSQISLVPTLSASKPYDVFLVNNTTIEVLVWTNDTTRATGLTMTNGILRKTGDNTRVYLGTIYSDASSQMNDSKAKRHVFNYYNQIPRPLSVVDTTDSWTYSTASYRQANGSTANQLDFIVGVAEHRVRCHALGAVGTSGATSRTCQTGVGLDSTTVNSANTYSKIVSTNTDIKNGTAEYMDVVSAGRHTLVWLEQGAGADTQTWYGDQAGVMQTGISGEVMG